MTRRIGTAGFSYPDWKGVVYPERPGRGFDPLRYLAAYVQVIEINSSFYRPPAPRSAERWCETVKDLDPFRFTAKLYQGFTHRPPPEWSRAEVDGFKAGISPLVERGLLGAVLAQFPFYFDARHENLRHLATIAKVFGGMPLVLEVRHRSFLGERAFRAIRDLGFSFCNVDQPRSSTSIGPGARVTGEIGYLRLHGRNRDAWFSRDATRDQKYDYLYSTEELKAFCGIVRELEDRCREVFVVANNHYAGKGLANALEMMHLLEGRPVEVPPALVRAYPRLQAIQPPGGA